MHPAAAVCPYCGVMANAASGVLNKTTAILLAVFLGPWTWIYTWRRDRRKFFFGLVVPVFMFALIFIVASGGHEVFVCNQQTRTCRNQPSNLGSIVVTVLFFFLVNFAFWLWAVVQACVRSDYFYAAYPTG